MTTISTTPPETSRKSLRPVRALLRPHPVVGFTLSRLMQAAITLAILLPAVFFLFRLAPGDAADVVVGPNIDPSVAEDLRARYGLDESLGTQFVSWVSNVLHGDFGVSFQYQEPVTGILAERLTNTFALVVPALALAVVLGIGLGAVAGASRGWLDDLIVYVSYVIKASPSFWIATMALLLLSYQLDLVPSIGMTSGTDLTDDPGLARFFTLDFLHHLLLPMLLLAIFTMVEPLLTTRTGIKEIMSADFMTLARAQGMSGRRAVVKHGIKNAMLPVVSLAPLMVESLLGGQIIMESVFSWPGVGSAIVDAVYNVDYPVMQAVFLITATAVILTNTVVDLAYAYLDPRVRL